MIDTNKLKAAWVAKGYTQKEVADRLNLSDKTLYNRMNKGVFGSDEIEKLMIILDISDPMPIFFTDKVT